MFVCSQWRPAGESICAECYSTGKTNLPGSTRQRHMLRSFSRMAPEMYTYSNKPEMKTKFPEHIRDVHNPENTSKRQKLAQESAQTTTGSGVSGSFLWEDTNDTALTYGPMETQTGSNQFVSGIGLNGIDDIDMNSGDFSAIFGD